MLSYNLPDPTEQERVRRGSHEYVSDGGVHGRYKPKIYIRQEYPKIMDRTPYPQLKDFAGKHDAEILLEHARKMWDTRQMASMVKDEIEEKNWLAAHADDPVLTPGAYPKRWTGRQHRAQTIALVSRITAKSGWPGVSRSRTASFTMKTKSNCGLKSTTPPKLPNVAEEGQRKLYRLDPARIHHAARCDGHQPGA